METPKVFGIGFHKTGTTSLGRALQLLGYRVHSVFGFRDPEIRRIALVQALERAEAYDAFEDFPWAVLYREMDERFPGSKFILTIRPSERWIKSVVKHFGRRSLPIHAWIYGVGRPKGHEARYIERYERHNREVLDYFRDRPEDLLVLRLTEGDGWEKLCLFLGKDVPKDPFPNENDKRQRQRGRVRRYLRHPILSLRRLIKSYLDH